MTFESLMLCPLSLLAALRLRALGAAQAGQVGQHGVRRQRRLDARDLLPGAQRVRHRCVPRNHANVCLSVRVIHIPGLPSPLGCHVSSPTASRRTILGWRHNVSFVTENTITRLTEVCFNARSNVGGLLPGQLQRADSTEARRHRARTHLGIPNRKSPSERAERLLVSDSCSFA